MSNVPGRNAPCPCNSGKQFKKCHGALDTQQLGEFQRHQTPHLSSPTFFEAREYQRREQQGLGRPIVSTQFQEQRIVAVRDRIYSSKNWKSFHDFLRDYPKTVLGIDWWSEEVRKSSGSRHLVVAWFMRSCEQMTATREAGHGEVGMPATGALSAYMRFAYDLYELQHAVTVEPVLIQRLKNHLGLPGAMYEVRVAASLLRAGFTLEMEDESDRSISHVEFIATHIATGEKFSVEAKRREGARLNINKLLHNALMKHAKHPRIVFIDTNDGRLDFHKFENLPVTLAETKKKLELYSMDPIGSTLPAAYVIATDSPEEHHLDSTDLPYSLLLSGFHVDDMQPGYKTLMEQVQTRRRHFPVFDLIESMGKHRTIPMSFNGEANAFENSPPPHRLQIGKRYVVPGPDGAEVTAILEGGIVIPEHKSAWCSYLDANGARFICIAPLTDVELDAYKQHPSTFFGIVDRNAGRKPLKTAMDHFDFMWGSAKDTPKKLLLEWMRTAPNIDELAKLSQQDLATQYCVRMAEVMMRDTVVPRASATSGGARTVTPMG